MTVKRKLMFSLATLALTFTAVPFGNVAKACDWDEVSYYAPPRAVAPRVHRYRAYGYNSYGYWPNRYSTYAYLPGSSYYGYRSYGYAPTYYYAPRRAYSYTYGYPSYGYAPRRTVYAGFYFGPRHRARYHSYRRSGISYVAFSERRGKVHHRYKARHRRHR